jgi:hypothetical protein
MTIFDLDVEQGGNRNVVGVSIPLLAKSPVLSSNAGAVPGWLLTLTWPRSAGSLPQDTRLPLLCEAAGSRLVTPHSSSLAPVAAGHPS